MKILKKILALALILILCLQNIIVAAKADKAQEKIRLVALAIRENTIEMQWTSKPKLKSDVNYEIYRNDTIVDTISSLSYKDSDLDSGMQYIYKIIAKEEGNIIAESNKLTVKTLASQENGDPDVPSTTGSSVIYEEPNSSGDLDYQTDRFIIKFKNSDSMGKIQKIFKNNKFGLTKHKKISKAKNGKDIVNLNFNKKVKLKDVIEVIKNTTESGVEYIQPDYQVSSYSDDAYFGDQWGLENNQDLNIGSLSILDKIEMLPLRLQEAIDLNPEINHLLMTTPLNEIRDQLAAGELPPDCSPEIVSEIINAPVFDDTVSPESLIYLCDAAVTEAWEISKGNDIPVGIIDTGIDINHEDLRNNVWVNSKEIPGNGLDDDNNGFIDDVNGWNFCDQNNVVFDNANPNYDIHGTNIAGIIAAESDNGIGIAGVSPMSKVVPIKVFKNGKAYTSDIINAIQYADDLGIRIINCSWGSSEDNPSLREVIENSDMLFVCAAGNSGVNIDNNPIYPASYDCPNIITVASIDRFGRLSNSSNYGEKSVNVTAPGESIQSAYPGNVYKMESGTSMAAAFVSGEAALLLGAFNELGISELKSRIIDSSVHLSSLFGKIQSSNKINCANALNNIKSEEIILVPDSPSVDQNNTPADSREFNLLWVPNTTGQFVKVSAGYLHSLAIKSDGTVWSWGYNKYGQLGDGTTDSKCSSVQVANLTDIIEVAGGGYHSLALKSDNTVWSWGYNTYGQLGDNTKTLKTTAIQVNGLDNVKEIAAGKYHSLALKKDGTVWAWGKNEFYQLGDGTNIDKKVPVKVTGLEGIISIKAGGNFSLALKDDGTVWAWGNNDYGQLGNGTTSSAITPVSVSGLSGIKEISAGYYHSLALKDNGSVKAWGYNGSGQLGNGDKINQSIPVNVEGLPSLITFLPSDGLNINFKVKSISAGGNHSLALLGNGTVWAWGNNSYGQLGDETTAYKTRAVKVSGSGIYTDISSGCYHSIALKKDQSVWVWGSNTSYQLGEGIKSNWSKAAKVNGLTGFSSITGGRFHNLVVKNDNTVWAWGDNQYGQLGDGTNSTRDIPVQVTSLSGIKEVAGGRFHSLALKDDGTVWAWGNNQYGQLGDGTTIAQNTPIQVTGLPQTIKITHISAGGGHSIALTDDGHVWAWGYNGSGQLGDETKTSTPTAVQVKGLDGVKAISAGGSHNLALKYDGTVWAWGNNAYGQLGDGTTTTRSIPVQVASLKDVSAISTGTSHSLALKTDGTVWAWGCNTYGQIGDGVVPYMPAASIVIGLNNVKSIAAGENHCLAVNDDGTAYGWGNNAYGQLGDGTTLSRAPAAQVVGLEGVKSVAAMGLHSLAVKNNGEIWAWGNNDHGQLGKSQSEYPRWALGTPTVSVSQSISVQCELNKEFDLALTGSNMKSFDGKTFTVSYDASQLDIVDLCTATSQKEQSIGIIYDCGIQIIEYNPVYGLVKFKVNKVIDNDKAWAGVINVIRFKSKISGTAVIQY